LCHPKRSTASTFFSVSLRHSRQDEFNDQRIRDAQRSQLAGA
jgi:hypothetical protein